MVGAVFAGLLACLLMGPKWVALAGLGPSVLPKVNASLSGLTAVVVLTAWWAVRTKQFGLHRRLMLSAAMISALFLASYTTQHASFPSARYGGNLGWLYYPMLISHILLAASIVPLVLITMFRALSGRFDKHRKIARWTLPIWLYVSITGVLVYLMCAPYY